MINLFLFFIYVKLNFGKINNEEEEKIFFKCTDLYDSKCQTSDFNEDKNEVTIMIGKKCSNDKICERYCVKKFTELFIGSKCNYNEECLTNKCENNICSSKPENCSKYYDCDPGYYCNKDDKTCKKMGQKNDECTHKIFGDDDFLTTDEDLIFGTCSYGLVCNKNKCVEIGSLEDGAESDNKFACKNFVVYNGVCTGLEARDMDEKQNCYYSPKNDLDVILSYKCPYSFSEEKYINLGNSIIEKWNKFVKSYNEVLKKIEQDKFIRKKELNNMLYLENKKLIDNANNIGFLEYIYDFEQNCIKDFIYNMYIYEENNVNNIIISKLYFIILIILLI